MRILASSRLDLIPVDGAHARALWRVLQQPSLREFQDIPRISAEEFERQVRARPQGLESGAAGRFEWLIRAHETGTDLGWLSLRLNDRKREHAELGYSLLLEARGKGYATEALQTLVAEAFTQTELGELHACTIPENAASRAVLDRAGFLESRVLRGGALVRNRRVDIILYVYTRAAYLARLRERVAG